MHDQQKICFLTYQSAILLSLATHLRVHIIKCLKKNGWKTPPIPIKVETDCQFFKKTVIVIVVPTPNSVCMSSLSVFFFILGSPIPAPKPISLTFCEAVE